MPLPFLIETALSTHSKRLALIGRGRSLSYKDLARESDKIAELLRRNGVRKGSKVACMMRDHLNLTVVLVACFKNGFVFVPFDSNTPLTRNQNLMKTIDADFLVCHDSNASGETFNVQKISSSAKTTTRDVCAAFFTSGSTSKPKAVLFDQFDFVKYVNGAIQAFALTKKDRFLQLASPGFDVYLEEIVPTIVSGGAIIFRDDYSTPIDATELQELIDQHNVSILEMTTAQWEGWVQDLHFYKLVPPSKLRCVLVGGERINYQRVKQWKDYSIDLIHVYGLTETTITNTAYKLGADSVLEDRQCVFPIGKALMGQQVFVIDELRCALPANEIGEIAVAGITQFGLEEIRDLTGCYTKAFLTGDRGYFTGNGDLVFVERKHHRVKILGHRVNLGELRDEIAKQYGVKEAQVILKEECDCSKNSIVAFVQLSSKVAKNELESVLAKTLPSYMIPKKIVVIDNWPLNTNSKIDRNKLLELSEGA